MDALQKLKSWLEAEKTNYDNINSTVVSDEAIKEAIRQIAFRDVMIKLLEFEGEETQEFLDSNFPATPRKTFNERLCEEIKHNAKEKPYGL